MGLELYYYPISPPCLSVMLLSRALDISLELKTIDVPGKEQYSEEFLKINPQHTVPFLVDDEFYLSESGAIMMYLTEAYASDHALNPTDPKERAIINQRLLFNTGTVWLRITQCYLIPVLFQNMGINDLLIERVNDSFSTLNSYLEDKQWMAGDEISIADYSLVTTTAMAEVVGFDISKHENVASWLIRCKETMRDYENIVQIPLDGFSANYYEKLSKIEP